MEPIKISGIAVAWPEADRPECLDRGMMPCARCDGEYEPGTSYGLCAECIESRDARTASWDKRGVVERVSDMCAWWLEGSA